MSEDPTTDVNAAVLAQAAIALAKQADAKADDAISGYRSCYQALGQLADGLRQLVGLVESVQSRLGRVILESSRPPPPDDANGDT